MYGHPVDPTIWARLGPRFGAMGSGAAMGFFLCSPLYWVGSGGETHADKGRSGAAAPEYIAILLIAAMFTSAVAVGVKPEWVQQKVCQALAVIFGKGSCAPAS